MADGRRYQSRKGYDRKQEKAKAAEMAAEQLANLVMEDAPVGFMDPGLGGEPFENSSGVVFETANFEAAGAHATLGQLLSTMEPLGTVKSDGSVVSAFDQPGAETPVAPMVAPVDSHSVSQDPMVTANRSAVQVEEQLAEVDAVEAAHADLDFEVVDDTSSAVKDEEVEALLAEPVKVDTPPKDKEKPGNRMPVFKKPSQRTALSKQPLRSAGPQAVEIKKPTLQSVADRSTTSVKEVKAPVDGAVAEATAVEAPMVHPVGGIATMKQPVDDVQPESPAPDREPMSMDSHGFGGWVFARLKAMLR